MSNNSNDWMSTNSNKAVNFEVHLASKKFVIEMKTHLIASAFCSISSTRISAETTKEELHL